MRSSKPGTSPAKTGRQLPEPVRAGLEHVVLLASVAAVLGVVYLLFIILSGGLAAPLIAGSALEQVTRNVNLAKNIFLGALWVVVIAALIRHYRTESIAYLTILAGAACWVALPLLVRSRVPETSAHDLMLLGQSLVASFQTSGGVLIVLGFLRLVVGRVIALSSAGRAAERLTGIPGTAAEIAAERALERPSLMRRCWELHFCRTGLRANCPRFLGGVSCWKKRSGCYCDQGLVTRLLSGVGADARVKVAEEMEAVRGGGRKPVRARPERKKRSAEQARCRQCPVYLEHQKYKYRVLSWLAYPSAAAVVGLTAHNIQYAYEWVEAELGAILAQLQVLPHTLSDRPLQEAPWLTAENAMVLLIGVLLVGIILQVTELAIFRFKL